MRVQTETGGAAILAPPSKLTDTYAKGPAHPCMLLMPTVAQNLKNQTLNPLSLVCACACACAFCAGASLNVIIDDDKSIKDGAVIVVPGHKERHHTVINVPGADGKVSAVDATPLTQGAAVWCVRQ